MSDKRGGSYVQGRYEVFAAGEVLGQSFDARLSSDNEGVPDSLRMRLYRTDPEGRLLGPLKATHYAVGRCQPAVDRGSSHRRRRDAAR